MASDTSVRHYQISCSFLLLCGLYANQRRLGASSSSRINHYDASLSRIAAHDDLSSYILPYES